MSNNPRIFYLHPENLPKELFELVNIPEITQKMFSSQVSGGEAQRAGIVRAVINRPEVVFADEPSGALNSNNSEAVLENISSLYIIKLDEKISRLDIDCLTKKGISRYKTEFSVDVIITLPVDYTSHCEIDISHISCLSNERQCGCCFYVYGSRKCAARNRSAVFSMPEEPFGRNTALV